LMEVCCCCCLIYVIEWFLFCSVHFDGGVLRGVLLLLWRGWRLCKGGI